MNEMSVYRQMITSPADLFGVLKEEIGLKTNCQPFAMKAITALQSLESLTESEAYNAANVFLGNLQTLNQGGIIAEDYDKIDFVKRGKSICISARVEAFYRAAARKGYRITDSIIAVPKEDSNTTYFEEQFYEGEIVYILKDRRFNADREITADRLIKGYFSKFICRLEVRDIKTAKRLAMDCCEMPNSEILRIASVSEQGLYKSRWEEYTNEKGYKKKRKVPTDELNTTGFWALWTGEMVNKTVIRRALKRISEVLPELKETIYAFEADTEENVVEPVAEEIKIDVPIEVVNVDLDNLTAEQKADVKETYELFKANPKLAIDTAEGIKALFEEGYSLQSIINSHYASIVNIKRSKKAYPIIKSYFEPEVTPDE